MRVLDGPTMSLMSLHRKYKNILVCVAMYYFVVVVDKYIPID